MKVYLIGNSSGSYDDYYTYVETGYFDKAKAEEHINRYNNQLDSDVEQSKICNACTCGKHSYLSSAIRNCKLGARRQDISDIEEIDGDLYFECEKSIDDYIIYDKHPARIKEVNIII